MKSQRFFFSVVAVVVILAAFFFFFFGIVKPRFQSAVERVRGVEVAAIVNVDRAVVKDVSVYGVNAVSSDVTVVNPAEVERVVVNQVVVL